MWKPPIIFIIFLLNKPLYIKIVYNFQHVYDLGKILIVANRRFIWSCEGSFKFLFLGRRVHCLLLILKVKLMLF